MAVTVSTAVAMAAAGTAASASVHERARASQRPAASTLRSAGGSGRYRPLRVCPTGVADVRYGRAGSSFGARLEMSPWNASALALGWAF